MSAYANKTADEREALAQARKVGEEVPKCAAHFNYNDACDLFRSHSCAPSEFSIAWAKFMEENMGLTKAAR